MIVQVLTIQCIRNQAKVVAMDVLYFVQWSGETEDLDSQSHRLVKQSGEGNEYSRYSGDCPNACH